MKNRNTITKCIACILILSVVALDMYGCGNREVEDNPEISEEPVPIIDTAPIVDEISNEIQADYQEISIEQFVNDKVYDELSLWYDAFNASVTLSDGTVIYGIGYSDFSAYIESDDGSKNMFPAGFVMLEGDAKITSSEKEKGLEIENLDYESDEFGFIFTNSMEPYQEHCVTNGKYIKYGIDQEGSISYTIEDYSKEVCDTSLGALYSYDEDKFLYDPDMGEYVNLTGDSLFQTIDYDALEAEINRILEQQDFNFSSVDIESTAYFAQEAVNSYLLSMQEETFMGCKVSELIDEVSKLDPMQCIRITPDGKVVVDVEKDLPQKPSAVAKWTVGMSCGIAVAGSIALGVFVPASTPATGAICGAAIDVFMQVLIENNAVEDINWTKVAISATSGAIMAWACPLGASAVTKSVAKKTGSEVISKLAGYGVQTFGNAVVSGATNAAYTYIDGEDDIWDAFVTGAVIGACCTVAASALIEVGHAAMNALQKSHPENWFVKLTNGAFTYIGEHQYHISNSKIESILSPKSVYEASRSGVYEYNAQVTLKSGKKGGAYKEVKVNSNGDYTEVHETPSFESTVATKREKGPSIKMSKEDHAQTASWGNSKEAQEYRAAQKALMDEGKYLDAIQMDITDIQDKFGNKYDDAIAEMLEYATREVWW